MNEPPDCLEAPAQFARLEYLHTGHDGELFFAGVRQRSFRGYRLTARSLWIAWRWRGRIAARIRHAADHGADLTFLIVPEKLTVAAHCARRRVRAGLAPSRQVLQMLAVCGWRAHTVDLTPVFGGAPEPERLYLRTDSHWTHDGAHLAYTRLCQQFAAAPRPHLRLGRNLREEPLCGDLGIVATPRAIETVTVRDVHQDAVRDYANVLVLDSETRQNPLSVGEGVHVVFRNDHPEADPRRLVIFGDSYSNHSPANRAGGLTAMLAETFREVHFLWTASYDPDYVARVKPDLILCEVAERYLDRIPAARFSVPR